LRATRYISHADELDLAMGIFFVLDKISEMNAPCYRATEFADFNLTTQDAERFLRS
jgi:hypothetical protein